MDDSGDLVPIGKKHALHQHRFAQLLPHFALAGTTVSFQHRLAADVTALQHRLRCQLARDHGVVDALSREAVDEPTRISREQYSPLTGLTKRTANGNDEWREVTPCRGSLEHTAVTQMVHESALQLVRRTIDVVSEML